MNRLSPPSAALECLNLGVRYGRHEALSEVGFRFEGSSLGLLGPNGAGKSTLIKSLLGLCRPHTGWARVLGLDSVTDRIELRRIVGYVPERDCHIPGMSAIEYATLGGELAGMPRSDAIQRAHEMLHFCGLGEARYRPVDGYSAGMKQRIKLAQALVHDPQLIFLDEPTNGLDPEGRVALLGILRDLHREKGIRIVLSSHLLRDVEFVCEEVLVIRQGRVLTHKPIADLRRISDRHWRVRVRGGVESFIARIEDAGGAVKAVGRDAYDVVAPEGEGARFVLLAAAEHDCQIRELVPLVRNLQDAFLDAIRDL